MGWLTAAGLQENAEYLRVFKPVYPKTHSNSFAFLLLPDSLEAGRIFREESGERSWGKSGGGEAGFGGAQHLQRLREQNPGKRRTQRQKGDAFMATPVSWLSLSPPLRKHLSFKTRKLRSGWKTTNYQHSCWFNWAAFPGMSFQLQDCTKSSLVPAAFLEQQGGNCHFTPDGNIKCD